MYVPIVAIVIVVVFGLARVLTRSVLTGVVMAVAIILAVLTFQRNTDYHDPLLLWRQVVARYPHGRAHYNLGLELKDAGRRDEAIREYRIAATELPDAEYALAFEATNDGHYDEAITRLRRYLELAPLDINAIRASNLLGRSLMASGRLDEATAAFRNTLRMQPNNDEAIGGLGESLLKLNRLDQAALVFRDYVTRWPDRAPGHFNLGLTLLNLHRFDEAVPEFLRAIALNPGDPATHGDLATALVQLGRIDEAIAQFREAAAREGDPSAREDIRGIVEQLEAQKKGAGHR
jgi:tetratricopeptide (TPR) repeat protein